MDIENENLINKINLEPYLIIVDKIESDINNKNNKENKFSEFILDLVTDFYNNAITILNKPKINEWSVFSCIIMQNNNEFKIITFSNGTKSLPIKNLKDKNIQICDSHAEIITMRAFKLFLLKCLIFNLIKIKINDIEKIEFTNFTNFISEDEFSNFKLHSEFFDIFKLNINSKINLKENIFFHLYISEFPCGDCSIFPINYNEQIDNNQTGSKTIKEVINYLQNENKNIKILHDNSLGQLRSKSMRNDIKKENISYSISCSDKILLKNMFGLQGKYLANILGNIYFSTITISNNKDNNYDSLDSNNENQIIKTVNRGINLVRRVDYIPEIEKLFKTDDLKFKLIFNEPKIFITNQHILQKTLSNKSDKNSLSFSSYWYFSKSDFSKIDPMTGYKQGTNLNYPNKEKSRLDICKNDIFINYLKLLEIYSQEKIEISSINKLKIIEFRNKYLDKTIRMINSLIVSNKTSLEELMQTDLIKNLEYIQLKQRLKDILNINEFLNKK